MQIDRSSPVPVAYQLELELRRQIEQGELQPGQKFPTEFELCRRFGISRTPVRRALGRLAEAGLLVRTPGRGTHVSARIIPVQSNAATQVVTATVLTHAWCRPLQQAAAQLTAEEPERRIRLQFNVVDLPNLLDWITQAIARGTAPDISIVDSVWVAEFAQRGYLWSFDQIDPTFAAELASDLLPPLRAANSFDHRLYALPAEADYSLLWYRKDWLAAEAMPAPQTWEAWLDCLRWFQEPEVRRRYGLGAFPLAFCGGSSGGETTTYQLLPVLWSAGADVIAHRQVVLDSEAARRAVVFIADLVREHRVASPSVTSDDWNAPALALAAGTVAFALGGSYESSLIRAAAGWDEREFRDRVGMLPIPAGPDGQPASIIGGVSYGIPRQSRQPALALELLARTMQPNLWNAFGRERGVNPPTLSGSGALDPETDPLAHDAMALLPFARPRWPLVDYPRVSAQIARMFEAAIDGRATPEEAVARAAAIIAGITGLPERGSRWPLQAADQYPLLRTSSASVKS